MKELIKKAEELAYAEVESTGMPLKQHIDLSRIKGKKLAEQLNADVDVVEVGTLLMDCVIGQAINEGKLLEHVQMCLDKGEELISSSSVSDDVKENIRHCISEHHGVSKFHSIESEICCNADCYRFISVAGFMYAVRYLRDMPFEDLIILLTKKVHEKWALVSLDNCKEELEPQYQTILKLLEDLK
jgi:hypothetical protein